MQSVLTWGRVRIYSLEILPPSNPEAGKPQVEGYRVLVIEAERSLIVETPSPKSIASSYSGWSLAPNIGRAGHPRPTSQIPGDLACPQIVL